MKAHSRGAAAAAAAIEFFTHPALPHAGHKASKYVSPSQVFPQSCFSQPICRCLVQTALRELLGLRYMLAFWPACGNVGCDFSKSLLLLLFGCRKTLKNSKKSGSIWIEHIHHWRCHSSS